MYLFLIFGFLRIVTTDGPIYLIKSNNLKDVNIAITRIYDGLDDNGVEMLINKIKADTLSEE